MVGLSGVVVSTNKYAASLPLEINGNPVNVVFPLGSTVNCSAFATGKTVG